MASHWENNTDMVKQAEGMQIVQMYLSKCYGYLNNAEIKTAQLEADGSFRAADIAKYKANQLKAADVCMTQAMQLVLWLNDNLNLTVPEKNTDDEVDAINKNIRQHKVKEIANPQVVSPSTPDED